VNDAHLFPREIELSRLNEAERRVLRLLGEGHTAKSIATALDSTEAAVNERLREARRKTGVGSSRELARLLKAQENRHEQLGVGNRSLPATGFPIPDAEPWHPYSGVIAMIAFLVAVAAGAAALVNLQPQAAGESDPLFASIFDQQDPTKTFAGHPKSREEADHALAGAGYWAVMRQLHTKAHSEPRDATWAPATEKALRNALVSIPRVGVQGTELRVLCGSTLCEFAGTLDAPSAKSGPALHKFNRETMSRLNPHAMQPQTDKIGSLSQNPPRLSYVFYYSRGTTGAK
jgi:DNA-binding CsgD family transcriptional regulator